MLTILVSIAKKFARAACRRRGAPVRAARRDRREWSPARRCVRRGRPSRDRDPFPRAQSPRRSRGCRRTSARPACSDDPLGNPSPRIMTRVPTGPCVGLIDSFAFAHVNLGCRHGLPLIRLRVHGRKRGAPGRRLKRELRTRQVRNRRLLVVQIPLPLIAGQQLHQMRRRPVPRRETARRQILSCLPPTRSRRGCCPSSPPTCSPSSASRALSP